MTATINASTSSGIVQTADTSGDLALQSNGTTKLTVSSTGAYGQLVSGTAQASTSGTSITFTGIPSWAKRITLILNGVSTNGSSNWQVQAGSGSILTSGYVSSSTLLDNVVSSTAFTAGFGIRANASTIVVSGCLVLTLVSSNQWVASGTFSGSTSATSTITTGGNVTLSGSLDRVSLTTVNGTDTFDAGSINILYEG